jgi:thiol-disulfide isomerase/thioredoxin
MSISAARAFLFFLAFLTSLVSIIGCSDAERANLSGSSVSALIRFEMNDSVVSEFIGKREGENWVLYNGEETIALQHINDTLWRVPVFSGSWALRVDASESYYTGRWVDSLRPWDEGAYNVPLSITLKDKPKVNRGEHSLPPSGTWDVWFNGEKTGSADAQLDIDNHGERLSATMRTQTGDYRYLTGTCINEELRLQTFDGAHLYLFTATYSNGNWNDGVFFSGNHYQTEWIGISATPIPDKDPMEVLHVSDEDLTATFINRSGQADTISLLSDSLIVLDILGTWCPNCMDEVRLLAGLTAPNARFVSIAFERDTVTSEAYKRLDDFASEMQMEWGVYFGGRASKRVAADAFPFLDRVVSFPTTLFIQGNQVTVHTGFNGPATGLRYKSELTRFADQLNGFSSLENR